MRHKEQEVNEATHYLAKVRKHQSLEQVWMEENLFFFFYSKYYQFVFP
jgi:hypothetical protein